VALPDSVQRHLRVLRIGSTEEVTLFNGQGGEYSASVVQDGRMLLAQIGAHQAEDRTLPQAITLLQALVSTDKMDLIVQKATELGVAQIALFSAARSTVKLDAKRALARVAHLQAVAVAACEQCGMNRVPQVLPVMGLAQALEVLKIHQPLGLCLALQEARPLGQVQRPAADRRVVLAIGPEGDFTDTEISSLDAAGYQRISLGPRVLRTETAGIAALAMLSAAWRLI
jgi:16S rRNA (uracil1498-N3)-methyltransferase